MDSEHPKSADHCTLPPVRTEEAMEGWGERGVLYGLRMETELMNPGGGALWSGTNKNRDGPLARPFARLVAPLTCWLVCSLRSLPRSWESEFLMSYNDLVLFQSEVSLPPRGGMRRISIPVGMKDISSTFMDMRLSLSIALGGRRGYDGLGFPPAVFPT